MQYRSGATVVSIFELWGTRFTEPRKTQNMKEKIRELQRHRS